MLLNYRGHDPVVVCNVESIQKDSFFCKLGSALGLVLNGPCVKLFH